MNGGWIKKWRKEQHGAIWEMPPLHYKVWNWILYHVDYETGSMRTSLNTIANGVAWTEQGRYRTPNRKTIRAILLQLDGNTMIRAEGNRKGTTLTVVNWTTYQGRDDEKVTQNGQEAGLPSGLPSGHMNLRSEEVQEVNQLLWAVEEGMPNTVVGLFLALCESLKFTEKDVHWFQKCCSKYGYKLCCKAIYNGTTNGKAARARDPIAFWDDQFQRLKQQAEAPVPASMQPLEGP